MKNQATLLSHAKKNLGKPYKYGAKPSEAPKVFDCSSFTQYLYKKIKIPLPRTALDQASVGTVVDPRHQTLQIGDLLFTKGKWGHYNPEFPGGIGHVGIYIGNERIMSAKHAFVKGKEAGRVIEEKLSVFLEKNDLVVIKRILPTKSSMVSAFHASNGPSRYDGAIVLAGGIKDDGSLPESVMSRVQAAVELYHRGAVHCILMSGRWSSYRATHNPRQTEAQAMARYAVSLGVAKQAILKEERSMNTESNVRNCYNQFLKPLGWKNIVVITSDFHMPRVRFYCEKMLGSSYQIFYLSTTTKVGFLKYWRWRVNERIALLLLQNKYWRRQHVM